MPKPSPGEEIDPLALAITRDMNLQTSKSNNEVAKWEHEDLAKVRIKVLRSHTDAVNKCQFFAGDRHILSASADCSIKVWDTQKGSVLHSLNDAHTINAAEAHCVQDGSRFASCGWDKNVHVWDMETKKKLWSATRSSIVTCCKISSDGRLVCVGSDLDHGLTVFDASSGEILHDFKDHHKSSLTSCVFSPDNTRIVTTSMDRTAKFFDLRSSKCTITLEGHTNVISACSFTQDDRKFATSSWDKTIKIWDISTGMYRSKGAQTLKGSHDGSVSCCDFTPEGLMLVSGGYDLSIVVWDVENKMQKLKLQGHAGWVTDVHFSLDQKWLLSCSKDKTVRMWNIEESDKIPIVMENKKAQGLKIIKCSKCEKPFSMSQLDSFRDVTLCVFCRLQSPEKSWLSFSDSPEG
ncbi:hypothetical protein C0Q70_19303 [Pomacea canaliculata]|uniref:Uncharacterized protein n=1 Tax=Pomacea canaliculata TaxID=400727 RepID=A0A2T7NIY4_POMCA|nr:WD repeat-containing protein 88-like [Pomacea canaliculata]PVD21137.1 hypothetical protein C0Q70_19303 [Pomacea canaliculata]